MNKLPRQWGVGSRPNPPPPLPSREGGEWGVGSRPNPPPPLPSREGGEWGVGSAPHSLGGKVRVFIPQGKTCPIFLSMLPNKTFMQSLFQKKPST